MDTDLYSVLSQVKGGMGGRDAVSRAPPSSTARAPADEEVKAGDGGARGDTAAAAGDSISVERLHAFGAPRPHVLGSSLHVKGAAGDDASVVLCPSLNIMESVAQRMGISRWCATAGFVAPLAAHDQNNEHRCVAAAMCTAMFLRACLMCEAALLSVLRIEECQPCVRYAYHTQRRRECEATQRCFCGPMCGGICDNCGTVMSVMVDVCKEGLPQSTAWGAEAKVDQAFLDEVNADGFLRELPTYRLTRAVWIRADGAGAMLANIRMQLFMGVPVILSLHLYTAQHAWQVAMSDKATREERGAAAEGVLDPRFLMPPAGGRRSVVGHAVTVTGMLEKERRLLIRNSYGDDWGYHGDCCMAFDDVAPSNISSMLAVQEVALGNLKAW